MATYKQIRADVMEHNKLYVQSCWIAHVKELHGLSFRLAHNRRFADCHLQPCPDHMRPLIEASFRRLKMV